jgi:succinate dehydrogenase / fumarate reductase membrane anchor subunit
MTHKGTATFIAQRTSAVILLPLAVWFLAGAIAHTGSTYEEVRAWLSTPLNASLMGALILTGAFHMRIGVNEIIDDYAPAGSRGLWKLFNLLAASGAAGTGVYSLIVLAV